MVREKETKEEESMKTIEDYVIVCWYCNKKFTKRIEVDSNRPLGRAYQVSCPHCETSNILRT